jgi:hypothetical protein
LYPYQSVSINPSTITPSRRDDKSTSALSGMFNICGTMASYGQYSNVSGGMWKGWTQQGPRWYSSSFHGNQYLSSAAVKSYANGFRLLGKASFVIGGALNVSQGIQAYQQGNIGFANNGAAKSGLDIIMGGVGVGGGPVGATASGLYFGVDMTVGWDAVRKEAQRQAPTQCSSSLWLPLLK